MSDKIPAHRHQVEARSAAPRTISGGNDDRVAPPKKAAASAPGATDTPPA